MGAPPTKEPRTSVNPIRSNLSYLIAGSDTPEPPRYKLFLPVPHAKKH